MEASPDKNREQPAPFLSNAEIADRLSSLAQLLSAQKENPYKVQAYRRAANNIRSLSESLDELVRVDADLTRFSGIGEAIAGAIREIVLTGTLRRLEALRAEASPALASISEYPKLDPLRVLRIYNKLAIHSIEELRLRLESGEIESEFGSRMAQHVRQGLTETNARLLYHADAVAAACEEFLLGPCHVQRAAIAGECRRRVEVVQELIFVIETNDFAGVVSQLQRYGGRTPLLFSAKDSAVLALSSGLMLRVQLAERDEWGLRMVACTGSKAHLRKLRQVTGSLRFIKPEGPLFSTEQHFYGRFGLEYIEPELREGHDEVDRAKRGTLPTLVTLQDIRGELHAHSTSSDGSHSIEEMARAAQARGYEYIGITDHSQSLKIAGGVSEEDLWKQIRFIDKLNEALTPFRILKSAEVDILMDGSLDYSDELLRELDYTVCSIHSRFQLGRQEQTERILRAMDHRSFNILAHPTGRLLLKRPGYEIDLDRIIEHAKENRCFFEINSSPDRLDLSAENARRAATAGVFLAVNTDAHSTHELELLPRGIDQARRAGLEKSSILNCRSWDELSKLFRR
jgi:DNA polymerase (family 10)